MGLLLVSSSFFRTKKTLKYLSIIITIYIALFQKSKRQLQIAEKAFEIRFPQSLTFISFVDLHIKINFHKSLHKELFSNEIIDPNCQIWRFPWSLNFYILSETRMLRNHYFSFFLSDQNLTIFSQGCCWRRLLIGL